MAEKTSDTRPSLSASWSSWCGWTHTGVAPPGVRPISLDDRSYRVDLAQKNDLADHDESRAGGERSLDRLDDRVG